MEQKLGFFRGRITRTEFVLGLLIQLALLFIVAAISYGILGDAVEAYDAQNMPTWFYFVVAPFMAHQLSLAVRRLHDIGLSGFYALVFFVPYVSPLLFIFLIITPGQRRANGYGEALTKMCRKIRSWIVGEYKARTQNISQ